MTHIEINPKILCVKPVIKGTRIPVYLILELLAAGYDFERIMEAYPDLKREDIEEAENYYTTRCPSKNRPILFKASFISYCDTA
jgi:uncharacterized protein (DUF433 family)